MEINGNAPGMVEGCFSTAKVSGGNVASVGGLVGGQQGTIAGSYSAGAVSAANGNVGGLVGYNSSGEQLQSIINSYATGAVDGGDGGYAGGLTGYNNSLISYSYSSGAVTGSGATLGGLIGGDASSAGSLVDNYWDTTTSGITNLSQGAGNVANDPGITGLSTKQLQAELPKGFSKTIWKESKKLNGGLPYLISNPPSK